MTSPELTDGGDNGILDKPAQLTPNPESLAGEFNHWAWGGLGRRVTENEFWIAYRSIPENMSFMYLDGCSSTPWLREIMRGQVARPIYLRQANAVVNAFDAALGKRVEGTLPYIKRIRQEKLDAIRLLMRKGLPRQIPQTAVFELLFAPYEGTGVMTKDEKKLTNYFLERFHAFPAHYLVQLEEGQQEPKSNNTPWSRWESMYIDEVPVSLADIIGTLTEIDGPGYLTPNEAKILLDSMAEFFAHQVAGVIRPRPKFISVDLEGIDVFRRFAYRNFPLDSLKTVFFKNILEAERHRVGDIRNLAHLTDGDAIGDETVSVYSIIEGFPFTADFSDEDALQIISEAKRVLRVGGKFLVFPWITTDGRDLSPIETALQGLGFEVKVEEKKKSDLLENMGERELALVRRSPVFQFNTGAETLPLLVATKMAA